MTLGLHTRNDNFQIIDLLYFFGYSAFFLKTNSKGAFKATAYFPTYSGWLLSDLCGKKPKRLTVVIVAEGFSTTRMVFKLSGLIGENETIQLPPISIVKLNVGNPTSIWPSAESKDCAPE